MRATQHWLMFACVCCFAASLVQAEDRLSQRQLAFFENRIRPILVQHCYQCHSAKAEKLKGGLRLDLRETVLRGGENGPAIVPGKPNESLLIEAIRYESVEMPPKGKLPDRVIADFVKWVEMGAPDPRAERAAASQQTATNGRDHWAFQPVKASPMPDVDDPSWPLSEVDFFILRQLENKGLRPAKDADRYTWLRRVTFDLTGLPPTVEQLREFVDDPSADAFERVVDRLLASRAFGERWARHWLDLVGYADQIGTSNNLFAQHAWRYRDYVIDSLNQDKPFDRFIREQTAGDLLPWESVQERAANLTATGFLLLGDLEVVEADKAKLHVDVIDQQVVKTSQAFLAMTVGCARCHDHKFDPITQKEYYQMFAYFNSIDEYGMLLSTDIVPTPSMLLPTEEQD
ncbi:MAG: DUF1549 domain-containing protein, partial [Planctomycetes bacterium]|nr:DUF1549 domain-containing protein [Planctomycetota bacterium]